MVFKIEIELILFSCERVYMCLVSLSITTWPWALHWHHI